MAESSEVIVRHGSDEWRGTLESGSPDSATVMFAAVEAAPLYLPLRAEVDLLITIAGQPQTIEAPAKLASVERHRLGHARATFVALDPDGLADASAGRGPTSERRVWVRVGPRKEHDLEVPVRLIHGPPAGRLLVSRLRDASAGGLGLVFSAAAEPRLCVADAFFATVAWPGFPTAREWHCEIRNRSTVDDGVRYGIQFRTESDGQRPVAPRYEPQWSCPFCDEAGLLAETHAHCPSCGMPKGDAPVSLPDWDSLVTAQTHRYGGTELQCGACGVAHGTAAVHCAHCGAHL